MFPSCSIIITIKLHKIRNMLTHRIRNRIEFSRIWFLIQMGITHIYSKFCFNHVSQIPFKPIEIGLLITTSWGLCCRGETMCARVHWCHHLYWMHRCTPQELIIYIIRNWSARDTESRWGNRLHAVHHYGVGRYEICQLISSARGCRTRNQRNQCRWHLAGYHYNGLTGLVALG